MTAARPDVTIIIPSFNYGRYLRRSIDSARAQTLPQLEILVLDNCSTDNSFEIAREIQRDDPRVRAERNERNLGLCGNHNRGLELARGKRVLFLAADDRLLPGHVARINAAHIEHPEIDLFYTPYAFIDEADRIISIIGHRGHLHGAYFGGRNEFADLLTYDDYMCLSSSLYDRDELLASGGFDEAFVAADLDVVLRMAAQGKQFGFIPEVGVAIRTHALQASGSELFMKSGVAFREHLTIFERHLTARTQPLIAGREHGIARFIQLIAATTGNGDALLAEYKPQVDAIAVHLNASLRESAAERVSEPMISVVLECGEDVADVCDTIGMIAAQSYHNVELVLVANAPMDFVGLLRDRIAGMRHRIVAQCGKVSHASALNDGLRMSNGSLVVYAEAGVVWPERHLGRVAQAFFERPIDVLIVPAELNAFGSGGSLGRVAHFAGTPVAQEAIAVGEGVPLACVAHKRALLDRVGFLDERLMHLSEFEFIQRLRGVTQIALDASAAITVARRIDRPAPLMRDASGYLGELQATYRAHSVDPQTAAKRERHVARLTAVLVPPVQGQPLDPLGLLMLARGLDPASVPVPS
jgi:GT2 family glycosyltransferase